MRRTVQRVLFPILALPILGCGSDDAPPAETGAEAQQAADGVVEVLARGLIFEAPSEIPAGWTTFRLVNQSEMVHFAAVERMPEGVGGQQHQDEVAPVFQEGYDLLRQGETDRAMARFGELPDWFGDVVFVGGPGLTAPGLTSEATIYLEPGTYLMECWVKTADVFHSYNPDPQRWGMVHEFTVTQEMSQAPQPAPSLRVILSSQAGITLQGTPAAGTHTFMVEYQDQTVHENFLGHDVHLARIEDDIDLDALNTWMDWTHPHGLESPAPVRFMGGLNEMAEGATGYFTVTLEPGRYALVAEVTNPQGKGMLHTFTVPEPD